jgi:hypothetical protein
VAIALNLPASKVSKLYREYWKLRGLDILNLIYKETNGKIWPLWKLYKQLIKEKGMSIEQVVNVVGIAIHKLPYMESLYEQVKEQVDKMQHTRQRLVNDSRALERKTSILDKIALSSEQECKGTEQRVQELADKKDRLEKLIANILNGEGYSKLTQFVKENVKAVISENKQVISVSFAAIIQTIKNDPEMVKLIHHMPAATDSKQYKDNNNIVMYLESNKHSILSLAEKNYQNLIKALTNNAIIDSSKPALSSSSSSLTFNLGPYNQSDISEIYHNSKGDTAE